MDYSIKVTGTICYSFPAKKLHIGRAKQVIHTYTTKHSSNSYKMNKSTCVCVLNEIIQKKKRLVKKSIEFEYSSVWKEVN